MKKVANIFERKHKIAVIGGGFVGSSIAFALSIRNFAKEIVLIDIAQDKIKGEAMDIQHGISHLGNAFVYAGDYEDVKDADLIVITAGRNRKPGETRLNLIQDNIVILKNIVDNIKKHYTGSTILVVANPVDVLTQKCAEMMGLENGKVFGSGCILDSSRFMSTLSELTDVSNENIKADVIGEHGDSMVVVWSKASVTGMPIEEYCKLNRIAWSEEIKKEISENVKTMGSQIISAKGRTHYGVATCVCYLAEAIINNERIVATVSSPFHGEYGIEGVSLSIPSIVSAQGVEKRLIEKYSEEELQGLKASAEALKNMLKTIE